MRKSQPLFNHDEIIRVLKETQSIKETAKRIGCSDATVHINKMGHNNANPHDKIVLTRGGYNQDPKPKPTKINDLPPLQQRIVSAYLKNPHRQYKDIAHVLDCNANYVGDTIRKAVSLGLIEKKEEFKYV